MWLLGAKLCSVFVDMAVCLFVREQAGCVRGSVAESGSWWYVRFRFIFVVKRGAGVVVACCFCETRKSQRLMGGGGG